MKIIKNFVTFLFLIIALYFLGSKLGAKAIDKMPAQRYYRRK